MDGAGSSAVDCEDVDEIQINVCRIAGNTTSATCRLMMVITGWRPRQFSAHFWDPQGDPDNAVIHGGNLKWTLV